MATSHLRSKSPVSQGSTVRVTRNILARFFGSLTILVFFTCMQMSSQLPASARQYDSSSSQQEREVRQVPDISLKDAVNTSKFLLTVYNDIVSRTSTLPTTNLQPNIIRSINAIQGANCDEFFFSLASINSREVVYRSDLRITLRFNHRYNGLWPTGYALQLTDSNAILQWNDLTNTSGDSYNLVVNAYEAVSGWVFNLDSNPSKIRGLRLVFFNSVGDFPYTKINTCTSASPVSLLPSASDDRPALVVYSRDPDANKIAAQALLKTLSDSTFKRDVDRQTRASLSGPYCGVNQLMLQASTLNSISLLPNQTIVFPPSFDGGICGGGCNGAYPDSSSPNIALITHFVTRSSPSSYKQCCVPIQFAGQTFVSMPLSGGVTTLTTLDNMRVTKCSCIDVIN